jgi:hypothetical protein
MVMPGGHRAPNQSATHLPGARAQGGVEVPAGVQPHASRTINHQNAQHNRARHPKRTRG